MTRPELHRNWAHLLIEPWIRYIVGGAIALVVAALAWLLW